MDLKGFLDNEKFYVEFILRAIVRYGIVVHDSNLYWQEFEKLDLVNSKVYHDFEDFEYEITGNNSCCTLPE